MAGAGYKLFNTGDVLTAAQVNTYLQEQAVMRFANATARTTALSGVLAEGMMSYLDDTNSVEVYNGSAWVSVGSTGDITGVTAGTGISGGGTSGDVTITNSMATAIDAKGDLVVGTGADTFSRLAVGSANQVLTVDSSTATGLKWAAASTPSYVGCMAYFFSSQNLTSGVNTILTFTNEAWDTNTFHDNSTNTSRMTIPAGYGGKYLVEIVACVTTGTDTTIRLLKNGANISSRGLNGSSLQQHVNTGGNTLIHSASFVIDCAAADYLEAALVANAASKVCTDASFSITFLGA
jgi:hypothetical protein